MTKKEYPPRHTVGIALPVRLHAQLKVIARREYISVSALVRQLINEAIEARNVKHSRTR